MSLREKALQPVASNNQLTSVAYHQVLTLKAGEILGYPWTCGTDQFSKILVARPHR
jgi:hypothetical protein